MATSNDSQKKDPSKDEMLGLFLSMLYVRMRSIEARLCCTETCAGQDAARSGQAAGAEGQGVPPTGQDAASAGQAAGAAEQGNFQQKILEEVKAGIKKIQATTRTAEDQWDAEAWAEAYQLERLLALVEPPETLTLDLDRRLNEAIANKLSSVERLRLDVNTAKTEAIDNLKRPPTLNPGGIEKLRSALINLLEEIHWDDQRKFFATPIQKTAVHRIVTLDLLVFVAVVIPYVWIYFRSFENDVDLRFWASLPLYTVLTVGAFGAYFSRLIQIFQNGDRLSIRELQSSKSWSSLFLRGAVGMCGALVVFFFLKSGLVGGGIFPDFSKFGFDLSDFPAFDDPEKAAKFGLEKIMRTVEPNKDLALLAMWSFVAGFSERLVPTILANTESSFANTASGAGGTTSK
jgi:hypothetical protein